MNDNSASIYLTVLIDICIDNDVNVIINRG